MVLGLIKCNVYPPYKIEPFLRDMDSKSISPTVRYITRIVITIKLTHYNLLYHKLEAYTYLAKYDPN
jgi:hypothetical protein